MVAQNPASISAGGRKQPQKQEKVQKKLQKKIWVVKLQRIPFGFFEKELLGYFRQFGNVLRIRVARSRKVSVKFRKVSKFSLLRRETIKDGHTLDLIISL